MDFLLSLKNISKSYDGDKLILNELSLAVQNGQAVFLVGPNGAGKTTLIKIILDLLSQDDGKIRYKGSQISQPYENAIKKQLGYLPDEPIFIEYLTSMENLNYYCALYKKQWSTAQLEKLLSSHGLGKNENKLVKDFSRGMRQKLSLCLLDIVDPELVLMDEPTIGLDVLGVEYLKNYIYKLKQDGKALLITSHDMAFCSSIADKLYLLYRGRANIVDKDSSSNDLVNEIEKNLIESGYQK